MNTSKLIELADFLTKQDSTYRIQAILAEVNNSIVNLASNPAQLDFQRQFSLSFQNLRDAMVIPPKMNGVWK